MGFKPNIFASSEENQKYLLVESSHSSNLDDFPKTMGTVLCFARFFGVPANHMSVSSIWCIILLSITVAIEVISIQKIIRALTGAAESVSGPRNVTGRISGSIFYANALLSTLVLWRLRHNWTKVSQFWQSVERSTRIDLPKSKLRKQVVLTIAFVAIFSALEHIMSIASAVGFHVELSDFLQKYILNSHGFLFRPRDYSLWYAIPVFIISKTATILWNFQDLVIILISLGLASRYRRLNACVEIMTQTNRIQSKVENEPYLIQQKWRKLREAYVQQAALVRKVDSVTSSLIVLSNFANLYFICLQIFLGVGSEKPHVIDKLYYVASFGWLCFRACAVVLTAAEINVQSQLALRWLHSCDDQDYNVEVQRLRNQLEKDEVGLSGFGFFYLNRKSLLKVIAAIITYEIMILQYDI